MAVYIGTVPPVHWEHVWDKAAERTGFTGPRPPVITNVAELTRHGDDIGALITTKVTPELLAAAPKLKLLQVPLAGIDALDLTAVRAAHVPLANSHGNREVTAEHAIALMFALTRRIIPYDRDLRQGIWHGFATMDEPVVGLFGKSVAIAGLGNIGLHIARVCHALGMHVVGLRHRAAGPVEGVSRIYGLEEKEAFCAAGDFVVDVLPLTAETQGFFGAQEFAAMKGKWFINIGRGKTVDEDALYDALCNGTLRGAGIDPWWIYPPSPVQRDENGRMLPVMPAHRPFWKLENVVLSPHTGGFTDVSVEGLWGESFENAIRADRGETPRNLVDLDRGY